MPKPVRDSCPGMLTFWRRASITRNFICSGVLAMTAVNSPGWRRSASSTGAQSVRSRQFSHTRASSGERPASASASQKPSQRSSARVEWAKPLRKLIFRWPCSSTVRVMSRALARLSSST